MSFRALDRHRLRSGIATHVIFSHAIAELGRMTRRVTSWLSLVAILGFSGCAKANDGPPRIILSGEVTFSGEPVPYGAVRFVPAKGSNLPVAAALIEAGHYLANNKGGVPAGTYRVEITGYRQPLAGDIFQDAPNPQYLPDKYNRRSEIEQTVKPGTTQSLDFHLE